jgi:hypothetical protein
LVTIWSWQALFSLWRCTTFIKVSEMENFEHLRSNRILGDQVGHSRCGYREGKKQEGNIRDKAPIAGHHHAFGVGKPSCVVCH